MFSVARGMSVVSRAEITFVCCFEMTFMCFVCVVFICLGFQEKNVVGEANSRVYCV